MLRGVERYEVATADINGTGTYEGEVADDEVLAALEVEDAGITVCLGLVAIHIHNNKARVVLCLLGNRSAVGQCSTATARTHTWYASIIKSLTNIVGNIPRSTQTGIVDTYERLVLDAVKRDGAGHNKVACRTVEDDYGVVRNSVVYLRLLIDACGGKCYYLVLADASSGQRVAAAAGDVIGNRLVCARRNRAEPEGALLVVVGRRSSKC